MRNDRTVTDVFSLGAGRYPHLKITREPFPRLLATRRIEDDGDEYYGAFLTKTAVRVLLDFVNRTFRLRTCDIPIDGDFPVPCTQFYRKRCLAPCVGEICSRDRYLHFVDLLRLFIADHRGSFRRAVSREIDRFAENLDFETAAFYRDILQAVERYWEQPRYQVWLNDAVDTYAIEDTPDGCSIYLVTSRGRHILGRKVFTVDREEAESSDQALYQLIDTFYAVHLPREIRVTRDLFGRKELAARLTERFGREAKIVVVNPALKARNAARGLHLGRDEHVLDQAKPVATPEIISSRLMRTFGLATPPYRVEAFDVAHISGTGFAAASAVWQRGKFLSAEYQFVLSDQTSELAALSQAVARRVRERPPDLVVLDGGKPQLNAVLTALGRDSSTPVVAAVKPRGKHSSISAFLSSGRHSVPFNVDSPDHAMLQLLRDEAHDLANRAHRDYRDMLPFYELKGTTPLVVPLRFHAENGGAEDLIPIETR